MKTPKTFKELFTNTGIKPTTDESGNIHYDFKATKKKKTIEEAVIGLAQLLKDDPEFFIQEHKQETLEELCTRELSNFSDNVRNTQFDLGFRTGAIIGLRFPKEKRYSEEEVLKFNFYCNENYTFHNNFYIWVSNTDFKDRKTSKELFEQFKNK